MPLITDALKRGSTNNFPAIDEKVRNLAKEKRREERGENQGRDYVAAGHPPQGDSADLVKSEDSGLSSGSDSSRGKQDANLRKAAKSY